MDLRQSSNVKKTKGRCFVIMPFSQTTEQHDRRYWTNTFQCFIRPSVEALGYECIKSVARPQSIIQGIIQDLLDSNIVLAILTDNNPNVWYELGIRHALSRGTIMAVEKGQKIPFDVAHFGVIHYDRQKRTVFQNDLAQFIDGIESGTRPDSPVKEFFSSNPIGMALIANSVALTPFHFDRILRLARHELFFIGQNLYSFAKDNTIRDKLFNWLIEHENARIRIMIVDRSESNILSALAAIIDESIADDLEESQKLFLSWQSEWENWNRSTHKLQVRGSNRIGNVSFTFVDGDQSNGMVLVRPILYHTSPKERPCFWINRSEHGRAFETYWNKYDQYWTHGHPLL